MSAAQASAVGSIFDARDNLELQQRIQRLRADSKPAWGRQNVAQMLAHCRQPLLVACGELQLPRGLIGILFGAMAKRSLTRDKPWKRNMPTHPKFLIATPAAFEVERDGLLALVRRFAQTGPSILSTKPHPFFGPLRVEEWDRLQWRHLDHHLRQFTV